MSNCNYQKGGRWEGWKDGRGKGWKDGREEGWKRGRVELSEPGFTGLAGCTG